MRVILLGGPYYGLVANIRKEPPHIVVGKKYLYERIDDPDTGKSLRGYAYVREVSA